MFNCSACVTPSSFSSSVKRDILERGRTVDNVLAQYQRTVKPSFDSFIHPTKAFADIIIPFSNENPVAIDMLSQHVASRLTVREHEFRAERETAAASVAVAAVAVAAPRAATVSAAQTAFLLMSPASAPASAANVEIPQNCHVMRQTRALRCV